MGGPNKLIGPFSDVVDEVGVKNQFIRNWVDLLSFMLSGLKADATLAAEVVSSSLPPPNSHIQQ